MSHQKKEQNCNVTVAIYLISKSSREGRMVLNTIE